MVALKLTQEMIQNIESGVTAIGNSNTEAAVLQESKKISDVAE